MRRMLKVVFLSSTAGIAFGIVLMYALGLNPAAKSGYANCVVAASEAAFTGAHLAFEGDALRETVKTQECARRDGALDGGDGPGRGRVRWVECPDGPDCDEYGMN